MNRRRGLGGLALLCAALIASTLSVGVAAGQTTPPEAAVASPGAGTLDWGECPEIFPEQSPDLDCTTMEVPLDHDWPNGRQIEISMLRRPADDQARKLGTIFMNPGGPGGDGVSFVAFVGDVWFTPAVRARYDLVGFDPRGIGSSNPLQCFDSFEQIESALLNKPWPETRADIQAQRVADRNFINACRTSRDPMLNHMSTANVARDLDLLRQAVGDDELHFAGYSYGSMIGANYAALFPDKVGSMIVDGVLDPIAWTTGDGNEGRVVPITTRVGSHISSQRTLEQYFELCDAAGPARCPFGPDSSDRFDALYDAMKASPLEFVFPTPDGPVPVVLTHQDLIDITLGVLYNSPDWGFFAQDLAFAGGLTGRRGGGSRHWAGHAGEHLHPASALLRAGERSRRVVL